MNDLEMAITLLVAAKCPQCDGSGTLQIEVYRTEAGCCGDVLSTGECCGNAIPIQVPDFEIEQCQWCYECGELLKLYGKELEV